VSGTIFVLDSLGRVLDTKGFTLDPGRSTVFSSPSVIVPQDIAITLTARATYDVLGGVTVGDEVTLTLCPEDIYERGLGDDSRPSVQCNRSLDPQLSAYAIPQLHDFSEADSDWLCFSTNATQTTHYVFVAHPLSPMGVAISLTVFDPQSDAHIHSRSNLGDITSDVRLNLLVGVNPGAPSPRVLDVQDYHLLVEPVTGQSGCWTDYELWVEEASWKVWLPVVMKDF